jgi:hypothetical protein
MKNFILTLLLLIPTLTFADSPATHGMLFFGVNKTYISHLPMFMRPHDYQLIAEISIPPAALATYRASLQEHPEETIYTLVPEKFVLPDLVAHPHPIHADLYRGHFERGGTVIAGGITVNLGAVLVFRKFDPKAVNPAFASYYLLGTPEEPYLAHLITAAPNFDQILRLAPGVPAVSGQASKVEVVGQADAQPLGATAKLELVKSGTRDSFPAQASEQLYLETGDLTP